MIRPLVFVAILLVSTSTALADSPYRNVTLVTWNRTTGTQVEYFDKTSAYTFVWRAGYAIVEPGQVLQVPGSSGPEAFAFGTETEIHEPLRPRLQRLPVRDRRRTRS